ncbi:hypothetical protein KC675_03375 [Candidatus Dojkabacteria bacterium]|uniref:TIGR02391 family protein n=1 Tax=Candidatus Dojkabacteria bacterium TaxID=2099670 RepID=A0A955L0L3_9BACT|nr:hypothetical protein [Candidatus Dojkabacteria bacterium]
MISRKTALKLGEIYSAKFTSSTYSTSNYKRKLEERVYRDIFYDFLFENEYEAWFCNSVKNLFKPREVKEHIAKLHTGETLAIVTPNFNWEDRRRLGQNYLQNLVKDILDYFDSFSHDHFIQNYKDMIQELLGLIELDGYKYKKGLLLLPEEDLMDVDTERNYLKELISEAKLQNQDTILHHLNLSEEHYINSKWDDSISNSRKFFEEVVRQVAKKLSLFKTNKVLDAKISDKAGNCINYIKKKGLLEQKEDNALGSIYVLMSNNGGHPYIAKKDQARLLRNYALTTSQFVLLRLIGYIDEK